MDINNLTDIQLIKTDIESDQKEGVIRELASLMNEKNKLISYEQYLEDVLKRDQEITTGIHRGIAIPHAKSAGVKEACFAIGKCRDVDWNSLDGNPVNIVILIAVPATNPSNEHLMILAKLAELVMEEGFIDSLVHTIDPQEIINLLVNQKTLAS